MHRWIFFVPVILEVDFAEPDVPEAVHFLSRERPRHLAFRLTRLSSSGDHKKDSVWGNIARHAVQGFFAETRRKNLESVGLKHEIECLHPFGWRPEKIPDGVTHCGFRKSSSAPGDGRQRDVERRRLKSAAGKFLRVVTQAASDREGFSPRAC